PTAFDDAFGQAMVLCAGLLAAGAVIAFASVRRLPPECTHPECRTHGGITAPPLEGRPVRGRVPEGGGS
ncbi:MFS transporter, partial [Streptomyces sp. T21Q-yed]|nr:MFS transporter [Streptomyces sp. T21Q-yed]